VIDLYQKPGWEINCAVFARDDRFVIFAIAPESRANRKLSSSGRAAKQRCRRKAMHAAGLSLPQLLIPGLHG
jgi:hypothetical protein